MNSLVKYGFVCVDTATHCRSRYEMFGSFPDLLSNGGLQQRKQKINVVSHLSVKYNISHKMLIEILPVLEEKFA